MSAPLDRANVNRAREFLRNSYTAKREALTAEYQRKLHATRGEMAVRGLSISGPMMMREAELRDDLVRQQIIAYLDCFFEGCEMYEVVVDETLAGEFLNEVASMQSQIVAGSISGLEGSKSATALRTGRPAIPFQFERHVKGLCAAELKAEIERRRIAIQKKSAAASARGVSLQAVGPNSRIVYHGNDNSSNTVTYNYQHLFSAIREKISQEIPDPESKALILARLDEFESSVGQPTMMERYLRFMGVLGDHASVIGLFMPQIIEMVHLLMR